MSKYKIVQNKERCKVYMDGIEIENVSNIDYEYSIDEYPTLTLEIITLDDLEIEINTDSISGGVLE